MAILASWFLQAKTRTLRFFVCYLTQSIDNAHIFYNTTFCFKYSEQSLVDQVIEVMTESPKTKRDSWAEMDIALIHDDVIGGTYSSYSSGNRRSSWGHLDLSFQMSTRSAQRRPGLESVAESSGNDALTNPTSVDRRTIAVKERVQSRSQVENRCACMNKAKARSLPS